jgi:Tfp pilus assembly protein PilZ
MGLILVVRYGVFMPDTLQNPQARAGKPEQRTSARYRLSPSPEIEILHGDTGAPIQASLGDLSQGGCFVETDSEHPVDSEVTLVLKRGEDRVKARARIVWSVPNKGLGLAFTSMEGDDFRILESWLSIFVATTWTATNRRRTPRAAMKIAVRVTGYNREGARFTEDTHTAVVSAFGGMVLLRTPVNRGQRLVLSILQSKKMVECIVAHSEALGSQWQVGLAFTVLNQPFWPVDFPAADWSSHHPDAKRYGS